jgi:hypothetical protein
MMEFPMKLYKNEPDMNSVVRSSLGTMSLFGYYHGIGAVKSNLVNQDYNQLANSFVALGFCYFLSYLAHVIDLEN